MASETKLRELVAKRGSIKGRVTKFRTYLDAVTDTGDISAIELSKLSMKLSRIEALFSDFDGLQGQIEILNEVQQDDELNTRELIEQEFDACISIAQNFIQSRGSPSKEALANDSSCSHSTGCHEHGSHGGIDFKLPTLNIPKFDGTYYKWLEFKEIYCSLLHDNPRIKNIHKFHYLCSYLEGEASRVLSNLEVSDKNYSEAWAILCNRYDNKRQLINNHLKSLFNFESFRETDKFLRFIIDHVNKNLRALNSLGLPTESWDVLMIFIILGKLDNGTMYKWEEHRTVLPEITSLEDFFSFLKGRADVIETVNRSRPNRNDNPKLTNSTPINKPYLLHNRSQTKSFVTTRKETMPSSITNFECAMCKGNHRLYECASFKSKSVEDRNSLVATLGLCPNCLRSGHVLQACKLLGSCRFCKKRHNSLLHLPNNDTQPSTSVSTISMSALSASEILLCTAKVRLSNPLSKETVTVRALLDSGSQSSFITTKIRQQLNLPSQPSNVSVIAFGNNALSSHAERCALELQSINNSFQVSMYCLVTPVICDKLPKICFNISDFNLTEFELADPNFNEPSDIDMLIGADLFWDLIGGNQHSLGSGNPILRSSKLGWLVAGPMHIQSQPPRKRSLMCNLLLNDYNPSPLDTELTKFWHLENVPHVQPQTEEEKLCERHFLNHTRRQSDGRFCVGLPLKDDIECLGDSYNTAKKRFFSLERRFRKSPELKLLYSDFIHQYAACGHLSKANESKPPHSYFLPHHPVIRERSESTKLRVVFNASAPTTSGLSVNDLQMVGPVIQDSLFNILLRFRQYKYVFSGDIEKMYRQVLVRETDRNLQLILWRDHEDEPLTTLKLNTVTYGFASASFLSTRCIWQLGEECDNPELKTIIQRDFFCDDLLCGADLPDDLRHIQRSISSELAKGGFPLRKYRSNLPNLLDSNSNLPEGSDLIVSHATSTLGIGWSPTTDEFHFPINHTPDPIYTKRTILSSTFKIFDPLGLLSLCTIKIKILIQRLWMAKLDWDTPVPPPIQASWKTFCDQINVLLILKIPRKVIIDKYVSFELHCFCDASQQAYGSCIYIRSVDQHGNIEVHLLCAKARVTPIKACTIPRLELYGALLGAQLSSTVISALRRKPNRAIYWTDSRVVLGWLNAPNKTKTFVANRVAAISEITDPAAWRHVPTAVNPADLASRGVDPLDVPNLTLWWHGPPYLKQSESTWPAISSANVELPELKSMPAFVADDPTKAPKFEFQIFSKLHTLQRVYAQVLRFIHNCKQPKHKLTGTLQSNELKNVLTVLTKIAQNESFSKQIKNLHLNKPLKAKDALCSLSPFLDNIGILRVGGRIGNSTYPYEKRHPILIKSDHHLSKLIFQSEHLLLLHAGPQHLLASIRDRYWPIGGRKLARNVVRNCFVCRRFKAETMLNMMCNLPPERVEPDFPFSTVGADFAGPLLITDRKGRGCKITKCYLCIFVCLRYKCLHLEVVSALSKDAFILTLNRFVARREVPKVIYCDNGRNFVAASKEISNSIEDFAARRGIEFRFSPAYAPHFNGLAEAGVKSAKFHLHRVLGKSHLTFEELTSVVSQIEAILNSRPLCPLSPSPSDLQPLTPAHFLIGRPLTSPPSSSYEHVPEHRLDRFQRLEQARQHFWRRWSSEYVAELQQRTKWRVKCKDLQLGDLVLIKEDQSPPLCWRLGRVTKLFPGSDGIPRVADLTTANGIVRRALNRLCLLPTAEKS